MQVILLKDVDRVGHEGDILRVADGYARNFLIPRNLATVATKGAMKDLEKRRGAIERRDTEKREAAQKMAEELRDKLIVVKHVAGEGVKLHGTVTTQQIADAALAQIGLKLDKRDLDVAEPIREIGDYLVTSRIYKDVVAQLSVRVVSEKSLAAEEAFRALELEAAEAEKATAEEAPAEAAEVEEEASE